MARLSMAQRRGLSPHDFAIPEKAPGHGSYPIPDESHVEAALRDCHRGAPGDCARVRAAVLRRHGVDPGERSDDGKEFS